VQNDGDDEGNNDRDNETTRGTTIATTREDTASSELGLGDTKTGPGELASNRIDLLGTTLAFIYRGSYTGKI